VREALSSEMWEQLNGFYLFVRGAHPVAALEEPQAFFSRVRRESHLFEGVTAATMAHDEGWHFGRLGRHLERADKTSRILDVKYFILLPAIGDVGTPIDMLQWSALLRSASALEAYRKRHGRITPAEVADFLILDPEFPRSIRYCVRRAEESMRGITQSASGGFQNTAEQHLGRLRSTLDFLTIDEIINVGLHQFLDNMQVRLNRVGDEIFSTFFRQSAEAR
jgi:uncharacterized alpha-E superfamily protein